MRIFVTGGSGFIGTSLVQQLQADGRTVMNFDCAPPFESAHRSLWRRGDILDAPDLAAAVREFAPTHIVHLAARADLDESGTIDDFRENTDGVTNLLRAIEQAPAVERLVVASTQMVCQPGYSPRHDEDFSPNTVYGKSKVITEQLVRQADPSCTWTIIRPTNIWGPWLQRHSVHLYALMRRGLYWHPSGRSARRCWGYVGNVAHQIRQILELPPDKAHRQVLYVGDAPFELVDWVNAVSMRMRGRRARIAPRSLLFLGAKFGDVAQRYGFKAPLSTLRYKAMTEDYLPPIERTLDLVGPGPYSMEEGIEETVRWLNNRPDHSNNGVIVPKVLSESATIPSESPLVCAYVITYDGKKFLERCFQTLLQHTDYANFRLYLVDNGSSDGSGDYVRENFPSVEVLRVFPNAGYTRAANEAVKHARSQGAQYIALLNDDIEILEPHWLREAIGQAERDSSIGIVGFTEPDSDAVQKSKSEANLTGVDYLDGFAMVMPLELFDRIGMFDEVYFVVGDEDDLGARAQAAGYKLVRLGVPIYHLGGGTNQNYSLRTAFLQMRNGIRFCIKNRRPMRALLRVVRILDVACNPWPLTFDASDAAHRRMRNAGNVFVNGWLWLRAVIWNLVRMPQTIAIRQAERRQIRAALAHRHAAPAREL